MTYLRRIFLFFSEYTKILFLVCYWFDYFSFETIQGY